MGRCTTSCFKIITCATDSVDGDDLEDSESKGSSDKRGWSFRKRSARHRVLSNTVISELPSSGNKESPESASVNFQAQSNSTIQEKTSGMQRTDEIPHFSTGVNSKLSETMASMGDDTKLDVNPDESVIIFIQAAIRGFLAQRTLLKHKNVVKLQAAVRRHLVRRHAVGTLRCVQAIVKMQALVRARRARLSVEGSTNEEKQDEKQGKDHHSSKHLGKQNSVTKPHSTYTSIEKLLSNRFACQLLESTPKTKPINIRCDPSRSDQTWKWLERWMSALPSGLEQSHKPEITELHEKEKVKHPENQVETVIQSEVGTVIPSEGFFESTDLRFNTVEAAVPSESEENMITYNADGFEIQACQPALPLVNHGLEQPQLENTGTPNFKEKTDSQPNQTRKSDFIPQIAVNPLSGKPELETEQPKRSMKRFAPEQPETEGRKFGSKKVSNPAFIAAQSKFEELSATTSLARSLSSSNQDFGVQSCTDAVSSATDNAVCAREEIDLAENSVPHTPRFQVGGSECGTELSITSTLDSPDRSEGGAMEVEQEAKVLDEGTLNLKSTKNLDVEAKVEPTIPGTDLSYFISVQPEKHDSMEGTIGESFNSVVTLDSSQVEQTPEENASALQIEQETETGHQAYKSSPEATPRSHITVPASQGTPSSEISTKSKIRSDRKRSNNKRKSLSAGKRSPINPNHDSGVSSSLEQLPKDHNTGKRRNSFGSARPDHVDQEPRDSTSSISLPSYMQATESARAKVHASSSPRSSPDVQDKDIYIKKRHSLPGANGRQGSPHIQRSSTKGNSTHPPHERKWQR